MNHFHECFDKHSFQELNTIDLSILSRAISFYTTRYQNPNPIFFDVGTNAGSFVNALQQVGITSNIHCFEPHPVISVKTKETYPYVNMNHHCLGNMNGMIDIYIPKWSVGLSSIVNRPVFSTLNQEIDVLNIKCETIDTYCERNHIEEIGFIKIDIEGAEKTVLEGATRMLYQNKIQCGIFEVGQTLTDAQTSEQEIISFLKQYKYVVDTNFDQANYLFYLS